MVLRAGYLAVALKLQEAADNLSSRDICSRLSDAINDAFRGTGNWGYYIDHFGDDQSGDVIYSVNGDTKRAPYEISAGAGAAKCVIDTAHAISVVPRTIYEVEQDEADHYAAMTEALRQEKLYTELPLYERFIAKSEREKATSEDFAGKGKSFPILKAEDIPAAVHAMGRAGTGNLGPSGIKARIIAIAKRKGWEGHLPKGWKTDAAKEGATAPAAAAPGTLHLVESAATMDPIVLREARADYEIKLIAPGKGSTAFYTREVLQRDGPKVFKAGTHVYLNHPTAAEEAARPEGDVKNLAGVLSTPAVYHESHAKGEGLYARMKVFADHATTVEEKAAHVGMSIRAGGVAESGKTRDGVPLLKELTYADSVDVVTKAGAGGMILTEAARNAATPPKQEISEMDAAELTKLQESVAAQTAQNARLLERAIRSDARDEATRILKTTTLVEAAKERVIATVTRDYAAIPQVDGQLDVTKFTEAVNLAAKAEGAYVASVSGSGRVTGMGAAASPVVPIDAKEAETRKAQGAQRLKEAITAYRNIGMPEANAKRAAERDMEEVA